MKKIIFSLLFALGMITQPACMQVPITFNLAATGSVEDPSGDMIANESLSICLNIKYVVKGETKTSRQCSTVTTDSKGRFKGTLNWKSSYEEYLWDKEKEGASMTGYDVFVGGIPQSSVEVLEKPTLVEAFNQPNLKIKVRITASPLDIKVAVMWNQARIVKTYSDRYNLLKDFVLRYRDQLDADQLVRLSTAIPATVTVDNGQKTIYYRDSLIMAYAEANRGGLSDEIRVRLMKELSLDSNKTILLNY